MPVLVKLHGIVIRMLYVRSFTARFTAIYKDSELVIEVPTLRVVGGSAPRGIAYLVLEWAALHQPELMQAWNRCQKAQKPHPIAPLDLRL